MVRLLFVLLLLLALPAHALSIAMVLWRGETAAEAGFRAELTRLGYQATITTYNADQDRTALATMLRQQMLPKLAEYDYIYTFGTTATTMTKSLVANRKPLIFNVVSDPVGADILSEDKAQNSMVAGVSNMVPMALQLANASEHLATGKRLLLPFNPREQNTLLVADMLLNEAKRYQWQMVTWRMAPDPRRLDNELKRLQQDAKNDIVFLAADSYLLSIAPPPAECAQRSCHPYHLQCRAVRRTRLQRWHHQQLRGAGQDGRRDHPSPSAGNRVAGYSAADRPPSQTGAGAAG